MVDEVFAVGAVGPALADAGMVGSEPVEESFTGDGVLDAGGGDEHGRHQASDVDDDAAFAADDPFDHVRTLFTSRDVGGGLDALRVDHEAGRLRGDDRQLTAQARCPCRWLLSWKVNCWPRSYVIRPSSALP